MELGAFMNNSPGLGKKGKDGGKSAGKGTGGEKIVCHHCGKSGHVKKDCRQLQQQQQQAGGKNAGKGKGGKGGKASSPQPSGSGATSSGNKNVKCWNCGKKGHTSKVQGVQGQERCGFTRGVSRSRRASEPTSGFILRLGGAVDGINVHDYGDETQAWCRFRCSSDGCARSASITLRERTGSTVRSTVRDGHRTEVTRPGASENPWAGQCWRDEMRSSTVCSGRHKGADLSVRFGFHGAQGGVRLSRRQGCFVCSPQSDWEGSAVRDEESDLEHRVGPTCRSREERSIGFAGCRDWRDEQQPFGAAGTNAVSPLHEGSVAEDRDDVSLGEGEPDAPTRPKRGPLDPTPLERDAHECAGHYPYRSWCRSCDCCVAGRGRHDQHQRQRGEHTIPVLGIDYGYLESRVIDPKESPAPSLVARDSITKVTFAEVLPMKGTAHKYCTTALVNFVLRLGHHRIIMRSDTEPAIIDLRGQAASALPALHVDVQLEDTGDSQEGGLAEGAVRDVKAQCRVLAHSLQELHKVELHPRHPVLSWMVMQAACSMSRGQIGLDGRTPHERLRGTPYKRLLPPFGEVVLARDDSKESRVQQRWHRKLYLGTVPKSNYLYVGDASGVVAMRSIRRPPPSERSDVELLNSLRGVPWAPTPQTDAVPAGPISVEPISSDLPPVPDVVVTSGHSRNMPLRRDVEIQRYGFTPGCPGCEMIRVNGPVRAHNMYCRQRIEAEMSRDGTLKKRREQTEERLGAAVGRILKKRATSDSADGERAVESTDKEPPATAMEGDPSPQPTAGDAPSSSAAASAGPPILLVPTTASGSNEGVTMEIEAGSPDKRPRSNSMEQAVADRG
eukprot:4448201-Amphidinium_carterae.4